MYPAALALHAGELALAPPARYPDLYAVLNVLVCAPVFGLLWLWSVKRGLEVLWTMGALGGGQGSKARRAEGGRPLGRVVDGADGPPGDGGLGEGEGVDRPLRKRRPVSVILATS